MLLGFSHSYRSVSKGSTGACDSRVALRDVATLSLTLALIPVSLATDFVTELLTTQLSLKIFDLYFMHVRMCGACVCVRVCVNECVCMCVCVCVCVCMCVCVYVCVVYACV